MRPGEASKRQRTYLPSEMDHGELEGRKAARFHQLSSLLGADELAAKTQFRSGKQDRKEVIFKPYLPTTTNYWNK